MHQRKIVNVAALFFQNMSNLVPQIERELTVDVFEGVSKGKHQANHI